MVELKLTLNQAFLVADTLERATRRPAKTANLSRGEISALKRAAAHIEAAIQADLDLIDCPGGL